MKFIKNIKKKTVSGFQHTHTHTKKKKKNLHVFSSYNSLQRVDEELLPIHTSVLGHPAMTSFGEGKNINNNDQ